MNSKNDIIINGKYKKFLEVKSYFYKYGIDTDTKENYLDYLQSKEIIDICFSIYSSLHQRRNRAMDKVCKMYFAAQELPQYKNSKLIFLTLTFNNEILKSTSKETRRRYVARFLKDNARNYMANIDYGEKNNREHYHAIVLADKDIDNNKWKYGLINFETIPNNIKDIKKVKNYVLKLNNHSFKNSTHQEKLIFDRNDGITSTIEILCPVRYLKFKTTLLSE